MPDETTTAEVRELLVAILVVLQRQESLLEKLVGFEERRLREQQDWAAFRENLRRNP